VSQQGVGTISPDDGLMILDQLMRGQAPQVGVMPMNWAKFIQQFGEHFPPFLSDMALRSDADTVAEAEPMAVAQAQPEILSQLAGAKPAKQRTLLIGYVQSHASRVLGLESAKAVNEKMPLNELGLDSLMAVELRNLLGRGLALKRPLPATLVFDYPTVEAIADYLARDVLKLQGEEEAEAAVPKVEGTGVVLESIEDLSDDEVDRLLQERMKNKR
jgi:acyl carrier protein